uniref:non-specific serine/threonine protein kinase n=1 Tax=Petromyzon marinus TaxID=7757 RepID=S4RN19_PETMA
MDAKHILSRYGYRLGYTLGEGTYSKVKFATSEQHERRVAIKVIDRRKLPPDFEEKFLPREVDLLRSLHHQNIVEVLQLIEGCRGYIFIVMELAQSDLLRLMQERGSLDQRTARGIFTELCSAVHYLHQMHVSHRDVKCENVLLVDGLHVRLTDFGFARQLHPGCLEELSKTYCGSAAYTSPEVLLGTPYDPRLLDLWSLGVVLFIMVTGYMPFDDSNLMRLVRQQKRGVIFSGAASVDTRCEDLILKLLSFKPLARPQLAQVFLHPWMMEAPDQD